MQLQSNWSSLGCKQGFSINYKVENYKSQGRRQWTGSARFNSNHCILTCAISQKETLIFPRRVQRLQFWALNSKNADSCFVDAYCVSTLVNTAVQIQVPGCSCEAMTISWSWPRSGGDYAGKVCPNHSDRVEIIQISQYIKTVFCKSSNSQKNSVNQQKK